jgi:hypothetical protein
MRKRLVFLVTSILLGIALFAVAYPFVSHGGVVAGY